MSVYSHPQLGQPPKPRRQNHSCDQCRRSKRACDAPCPDLTGRLPSQRQSCSYCAKTKKRCTMTWARSRAKSTPKPNKSMHLDGLLQMDLPWMEADSAIDIGAGNWDELEQPSIMPDIAPWNPEAGSVCDSSLIPLNFAMDEGVDEQGDQAWGMDSLARSADFSIPAISNGFDVESIGNYSSFASASRSSSRRLSDSSSSGTQPFMAGSTSQYSISPFSIQEKMIRESNTQLTSANLLQIYHDVLEHNLSCWLSETTCPYQPLSQKSPNAAPEWGASWSNRIYQRTIKLDRVAQSRKILQMTRSEDKAASKALHLAIMAFATQWAQGSRRSRERYPAQPPFASCDDGLETGISNEFDRVLQNHFWDQAQRALRRLSHIESYRVACAEIILGLMQRPWTADGDLLEMDEHEGVFSTQSVLAQVREIIRQDGPPVYMESAARKMHALKYRFEMWERTQESASLDPDDRGTIGLLYWLAIMFDTVSSSMNERPVVVVDEECQHEAHEAAGTEMDIAPTGTRWNLDLFVPGGLDDTSRTHWPCSYETAAEDVTNSAPVKVLLFRHVSYLQNAIRKRAPKSQVEEVIRSTLALYQYWNKTHGAFFAEMVTEYTSVPQRIQGWFVCISAHWHLAALMLADLLEFVDGNCLGTEDAIETRKTSRVASRIREHSVDELADLARVATPETADADIARPQMPDFHHAVNEGTLLTEPWTIILIRAFSKACVVLFDQAEEALRCAAELGLQRPEFQHSLEKAEDCIRGMWLLGKKSDMARRIAQRLSRALADLRARA
ncbi:hypothetical protein BDV18DRAFT_134386 [Aspergillus unguis]